MIMRAPSPGRPLRAQAADQGGIGVVLAPRQFRPSGLQSMTALPDFRLLISMPCTTAGAASGYVARRATLRDDDGFVDSGDMVERRGDRFYFVGRRGGIINIGGLKVHPEEVEAVINRHPQVRMSLVRPKRSPFTGAIVIADVLLKSACERAEDEAEVKAEILKLCRNALPRHKVPAAISIVPALAVAATGKLARRS